MKSFTQNEIINEAKAWMEKNYSICKQEHPDIFYEKFGLLVDFVTDLIPTTINPEDL